jgi:hypothetical protein
MGRKEMRNLETYKIGDSQVNEFEYQKHQGEMTQQADQHPDELAKGPQRPTQAERVKQITAAAHEKVEKKRKKEAAGKHGETPKKPAAKSAASRKSSKVVAAKASGQKSSAKKGTGDRNPSAAAGKQPGRNDKHSA